MTSLRFAAVIGEIDDNFTESAVKKTVGLRTKRILAAAACFLAAGLVAFGLIQAKVFKHERKLDMTVSIPEDAVLPPADDGNSAVGHASYGEPYSVEKAFRKAAAVCLLTVGNYITENDYQTYYEASVGRVYKGDLPENIIIQQFATSWFTLDNSPRFTYGDKLLLFLDPTEQGGLGNTYRIIGADIAFFYAAPSSEGEIYLFDHKGLFSYNTYSADADEHPFTVPNRSSMQLVSDFCEYYSSFDKAIADRLDEYYEAFVGHETAPFALNVYSLEDMEGYFSQLD